jgi:transposase
LSAEKERNRLLELEIALLRQKIDFLSRRVYGASSEKLDPGQLELLLGGEGSLGKSPEPALEAEAPRCSKAGSTPRRGSRPKLPANLPVIEEEIVPEVVRLQPEEWVRTALQPEISERLDYEPAKFLLRRTIRPKFVKKGELGAAPVIAPLPPCLLEKSLVSPGLLAQVVVGKYCDHLPLHRQEDIFYRRHDIWLPRQTLSDWMLLGADWLKPIYQHIRGEVLSRNYVQLDETPIRYLVPGNGKTKLGYLWTGTDPATRQTVYEWHPSRAADCLEKILPANFSGIIQCDGYEGYGSFARNHEEVTLAGCMAHVRRRFDVAKQHAPKIAGWFLRQIQNLYRIESDLREVRAGPRLRQAKRASASRLIMERLGRALVRLQEKKRFLPGGDLAKALAYALARWPFFKAFLEDGRVEIDNNLVENAIRPTAIGKKNWLFIGAADAGERSAIIYTIIEACRRNQIDPFAYLRDVFTRLPSSTNKDVPNLTPKAWADALRRDRTKLAA